MARRERDQDRADGMFELLLDGMAPYSISETKTDTSQVPSVLYYDSAMPPQNVVGWGHDRNDAIATHGYPNADIVCP